jgi:hypothetical protein
LRGCAAAHRVQHQIIVYITASCTAYAFRKDFHNAIGSNTNPPSKWAFSTRTERAIDVH